MALIIIGCMPVQKTYSKIPQNTKLRIQKEFNNITQTQLGEKYKDWEEYAKEKYPDEYQIYTQTCSYSQTLITFLIILGGLSILGVVTVPPLGIAGGFIEIFLIIVNWSAVICVLA